MAHSNEELLRTLNSNGNPTYIYYHYILLYTYYYIYNQIVLNVKLLRKYKKIVDSVNEYKCHGRCSFNFGGTSHEL